MASYNTVTFNVTAGNKKVREAHLLVDKNSTKIIQSILGHEIEEGGNLTAQELSILQQTAKKGGNMTVLEDADLSPEQKLNQAKFNGYGEYYKLSLSPDKKFIVIEVKKTGGCTPDPKLCDIKADFGIPDNIIVQKKQIPYGNRETLELRKEDGNGDFDKIKLRPGDKLNIPINCIKIQDDGPRGAMGRIFKWW